MLRASLMGLVAGGCLAAPAVIFYRQQIVAGWKEVFGFVPEGTAESIAVPVSTARRFRRPLPVVILLTVVAIASGLVAVGPSGPLTVTLAAAVTIVTTLLLGLHILAASAAGAERQTDAP